MAQCPLVPVRGGLAVANAVRYVLICSLVIALSSCGSKPLPTIDELLRNAAGRFVQGTVRNADGSPAAGQVVEIAANNGSYPEEIVASGSTDDNGVYRIRFLWNRRAEYELRIPGETEPRFLHELGRVEKEDITLDISLP